MNRENELTRLIAFYENLSPQSIARELSDNYAPDAHFKDPFNDVTGRDAVGLILAHMFTQVNAPRFKVKLRVLQGADAFITWDFLFHMKRFSSAPQCIHGASHLCFDRNGLVIEHRDYWDAAEELYAKLPLVGGLMRLLNRAAKR